MAMRLLVAAVKKACKKAELLNQTTLFDNFFYTEKNRRWGEEPLQKSSSIFRSRYACCTIRRRAHAAPDPCTKSFPAAKINGQSGPAALDIADDPLHELL